MNYPLLFCVHILGIPSWLSTSLSTEFHASWYAEASIYGI